jgi:hypothetical protein
VSVYVSAGFVVVVVVVVVAVIVISPSIIHEFSCVTKLDGLILILFCFLGFLFVLPPFLFALCVGDCLPASQPASKQIIHNLIILAFHHSSTLIVPIDATDEYDVYTLYVPASDTVNDTV